MLNLNLRDVPMVLEDEEMPFVVGLSEDRRRALSMGGMRYRRGRDRLAIEVEAGGPWLRALLVAQNGCYLMASAGPLLNEWWPLLQKGDAGADRPFLSAGVNSRPLTMRADGVDLRVLVVPPSEFVDDTTAVLGLGRHLDDETLQLASHVVLAVMKVALSLVVEYRTLLTAVPDVDVQAGATSVPLASLLDFAATAREAILWERVD